MYYPEATFLERAEYSAGLNKRKSETELVEDGVYSIMFRLVDNDRSREAATLPAKILGKTAVHQRSGLHELNLQMLDGDLQPKINVMGGFLGGYWVDVRKCLTIVDPVGERLAIPAQEAYVKDYDDGMDEFRRITESIRNRLLLESST